MFLLSPLQPCLLLTELDSPVCGTGGQLLYLVCAERGNVKTSGCVPGWLSTTATPVAATDHSPGNTGGGGGRGKGSVAPYTSSILTLFISCFFLFCFYQLFILTLFLFSFSFSFYLLFLKRNLASPISSCFFFLNSHLIFLSVSADNFLFNLYHPLSSVYPGPSSSPILIQ